MSSPVTFVTPDEVLQFREWIDEMRAPPLKMSWQQIGVRSEIMKWSPRQSGGTPASDTIKAAYDHRPTTEVFRAVQKLYAKVRPRSRPGTTQPETDMEMTPQQERMARARAARATSPERMRASIIAYVRANPGTTKGDVVKSRETYGDTTSLRAMVQALLQEGVIVDRNEGGRYSSLSVPNGNGNGHAHAPLPVVAPPPPPPPPASEPPVVVPATPAAQEAVSWESVKQKLFSAADDLLKVAESLYPKDAPIPESIRQEITGIFRKRHDRLLEFIETELE